MYISINSTNILYTWLKEDFSVFTMQRATTEANMKIKDSLEWNNIRISTHIVIFSCLDYTRFESLLRTLLHCNKTIIVDYEPGNGYEPSFLQVVLS